VRCPSANWLLGPISLYLLLCCGTVPLRCFAAGATPAEEFLPLQGLANAGGATPLPWLEGAVLLVGILAVVGLIALWQSTLGRLVRQQTSELSQAQENLNVTISSIPDPLIELSPEGEILSIHSAERGLFHLPEPRIGPTHLRDVLSAGSASTMVEALAEAVAKGRSNGRQLEIVDSGASSWFEVSIARRKPQNGEPPSYLMLCRDITERKRNEAKILRLNRLYATLSAANEAAARVETPEQLLEESCRLAVTSGEMRLAWVGMIEPQSNLIKPEAWFGEDIAYVQELSLGLTPYDAKGSSPFAMALREDHPVWINDFMADPLLMPWHELARPYGWGAAAYLPLHRDHVVIGGLAIYAGESDIFDSSSQQLLLDLVGDIDKALDRFSLLAARKTLEDAIKASEEKFRQITESTHEVIWSLDAETLHYLYVSPSVQRLRGYTVAEVMEQRFEEAFTPAVARGVQKQIRMELAEFKSGLRSSDLISTNEHEQLVKDGLTIWTEMVTRLVLNPVTGRVEVHGVTRDITDRKFALEQIERLSYFDPLTGLANRTLVQNQIMDGIKVAKHSNHPLALLVLDLDNFRFVNDNFGHEMGDRVLMEVALRLKANLTDMGTVAHTGGDEFVVVLPDSSASNAVAVAEQLRQLIAQPYNIGTETAFLSASVGIAIYPVDGTTQGLLMTHANAALHQIKLAGRNDVKVFSHTDQVQSARKVRIINAMHQALEREEFNLVYQPQLELSSNMIFGAEALIRWIPKDQDLGSISPAEFIPLAESSGLIIPIGDWVMRRAIKDAHSWTEHGLPPLTVSVNVSAVQFEHVDLANTVIRTVQAEGLPPNRLEVELTESVTLEDPEKALVHMQRLSALGIQLAIDDFGTGYSSLSYLKRIRAHRLKIDQSFIRNLVDDEDDRAIVVTIINLARSMNLRTIAEGVETLEQLAVLRSLGCDEIQGFLLSRPLPQEAFLEFVKNPVRLTPSVVATETKIA
jgi:diguanylate cyclase (GGDEF)-like protein/PAS domain S-box-containing protein